jgi:hypothetical protein
MLQTKWSQKYFPRTNVLRVYRCQWPLRVQLTILSRVTSGSRTAFWLVRDSQQMLQGQTCALHVKLNCWMVSLHWTQTHKVSYEVDTDDDAVTLAQRSVKKMGAGGGMRGVLYRLKQGYPSNRQITTCYTKTVDQKVKKVKLSLFFNWAPRHEGVVGEWRYCSMHYWLRPWVVSFTPRLLYPQGKNPWNPLERRLRGPQSRSGRGGEKNSQSLPGLKPPIIQSVAQRYTTDLSQLLSNPTNHDMWSPNCWSSFINKSINWRRNFGDYTYIYICMYIQVYEINVYVNYKLQQYFLKDPQIPVKKISGHWPGVSRQKLTQASVPIRISSGSHWKQDQFLEYGEQIYLRAQST